MFTTDLVAWCCLLVVLAFAFKELIPRAVEAEDPFACRDDEVSKVRPTRSDIYHVAFLLRQKVPPELAVQILDFAEYWLKISTVMGEDAVVPDMSWFPFHYRDDSLTGISYLCSRPIGEDPHETNGPGLVGLHPARKVVFTVTSKDQGWSSFSQHHGTEEGSYTWFEACARDHTLVDHHRGRAGWIRRLDRAEEMLVSGRHIEPRPLPARGRELFRNIHAGRHWRTKTIQWGVHDDEKDVREWVDNIKNGQLIELTAWAQYPGWENHVKSAQIDVYLAAVR